MDGNTTNYGLYMPIIRPQWMENKTIRALCSVLVGWKIALRSSYFFSPSRTENSVYACRLSVHMGGK